MASDFYRTCCLAVFTALAVGCEANHYEIKLTPKGKSVDRQLTCWREKTSQDKGLVESFPGAELGRISAVYDVPVPADAAKKHEFSAEFAARMPDDVGGSGSYNFWDTPLGSSSAYVERFRGNDNLVLEVERQQQAADRTVDLLIGWFTAELEHEPEFPELKQFLNVDFRQDLKNLSLYGWAYDVTSRHSDNAEAACLIRVGQYLSERGYFTVDQLPALARVLRDLDGDSAKELLSLMQRFIASKMGFAADQPIPDCLNFLSNVSAIKASSRSYLRGTDEYKQLLESWEAERASNPEAERPQPEAVLEELVSLVLLSNVNLFGGGRDQLSVSLVTTTEPFLTNGEWDESTGQIGWSRAMVATDSDRTEYPALLYAFWSIPNEMKQKAQFGRIVLEGDALGTYCLWYRGLNETEADEWDGFISSLRPDQDLVNQIGDFRFSHERPDDEEEQTDLASTPRDLILTVLADESTGEQ